MTAAGVPILSYSSALRRLARDLGGEPVVAAVTRGEDRDADVKVIGWLGSLRPAPDGRRSSRFEDAQEQRERLEGRDQPQSGAVWADTDEGRRQAREERQAALQRHVELWGAPPA